MGAEDQIKTVKIPQMFGADAVQLYKDANEAHPATAAVKSLEAAENCLQWLAWT